MDPATIIGIVLGAFLVLGAILIGESPVIFFDVPSVLIVFGGTMAVTLIRNPLKSVLGTMGVVRKAFTTRVPRASDLSRQVVELSRKARKESLLALESVRVGNPFLSKGLGLCVDGFEPGQIRSILEAEITATAGRHKRGREVLDGIGSAAPAFGMIGTLIGLVQMLTALDNPDAIGPAIATALLTTLYGALIANLFALPLSDKLRVRSTEEVLNMTVCLEGVLGIVQGEHPAAIDERLSSYIAPNQRISRFARPHERAA